MMPWFNLAWWGHLILWAGLLIHCLCKRRFFPVLGRGWGTKAFWLVTFVFMNPLLTLLYLIFGLVLKAKKEKTGGQLVGSVLCLVLVLLVIAVFEVPRPVRPGSDITIRHAGQEEEKDKGFRFQAHAGVLEANNSHSTASSTSKHGNARFSARSIIIRSESDHLLIDKVCRFVQDRIIELPYVEQVAYWPAGADVNLPSRPVDLIVALDASEMNEGGIGRRRTLETTLSCAIGRGPVLKIHTSHYGKAPVLGFSMNCTLRHSSTFKGIESRRARYKQQSENIGKALAEALTKQLDDWAEECGLLPELPDYLYGSASMRVAFDFLGPSNAKLIYQSGGLLQNCHAVWRYQDDRTNVEAFRELRNTLQEQGWRVGNESDDKRDHKLENFTMHQGDDHIQVFRQRGRRPEGGILYGDDEDLPQKLPIVVEYMSVFTQEQADNVLERLFSSDVDLETKLIFEHCSSAERVKRLLSSSLESQKVKTMQGYLLLGRHYAAKAEQAKATDALMLARALGRAQRKHNPAAKEIEALAKQIGDESLAQAELGVEHYRKAGFIDMSAVGDDTAYERAVDEPLMFYGLSVDGRDAEQTQIKTVAIYISKSGDPAYEFDVETVTKQGGSSSTRKGSLPGEIVLRDPMAHKQWFRLNIAKLEGDKFKLQLVSEPVL